MRLTKTVQKEIKHWSGGTGTVTYTRPTSPAYVLATAIIVLLLAWMFCVRVVGVGQVGIVTRLGSVNREWQSGMHLKLPWPIESETKMNIQIQKEQINASAATQDLQTVTTSVALNYNLTPATANKVFREVGTAYKERVIDPILQETVKATTSQYNATDLIDRRPEVEAKTLTALQAALGQRGITVDNFSIVNFQFSDQFSQAIEQKQVAAQNVQKEQYNLQAAQLQAQAQATQKQSLSPEYLELQAIQKWDGKMPQVVGNGGNIFGINLQGN